jgi:hypothetical protein
MPLPETAYTLVEQYLWTEILRVAKNARGKQDEWMHGYRAGMVKAYAVTTGLTIDKVNKMLITDLRKDNG